MRAVTQYGEERIAVAAYSDLVRLFDSTLAADAASVDIQGISQNYEHLRLIILTRSSAAAPIYGAFRFNNDSGGNYDDEVHLLRTSPGQAVAAAATYGRWGTVNGSGMTAGAISPAVVDIPHYRGTTLRKAWTAHGWGKNAADGTTAELIACLAGGEWRSTAAINRITVLLSGGNLVAGSRVTLYGMRTQGEAGALLPTGQGEWYATTLPGDPYDGMIANLVVDAAAGVVWRFRYDASQATYKWVFLGGSPLFSEVTTAESTSSTSYVALATAGPSVTLPRAGDYDVEIGAAVRDTATATAQAIMSYDIGGTAAVDADAMKMVSTSSGAGRTTAGARRRRKTGLGAVTLTAKYKHASGTAAEFEHRWMRVTPVRVAA